MDEDEIIELGEELVGGVNAGITHGDAVERLRDKGGQTGVDEESQFEYLADVLERVKRCNKESRRKRERRRRTMVLESHGFGKIYDEYLADVNEIFK